MKIHRTDTVIPLHPHRHAPVPPTAGSSTEERLAYAEDQLRACIDQIERVDPAYPGEALRTVRAIVLELSYALDPEAS